MLIDILSAINNNMAMSLRKHAFEIFYAGLSAVEPDVCTKNPHGSITFPIFRLFP